MLHEEDIAFCVMCQQYVCTGCMKNEDETKAVFMFMSQQQTKDVHCPYCNGTV